MGVLGSKVHLLPIPQFQSPECQVGIQEGDPAAEKEGDNDENETEPRNLWEAEFADSYSCGFHGYAKRNRRSDRHPTCKTDDLPGAEDVVGSNPYHDDEGCRCDRQTSKYSCRHPPDIVVGLYQPEQAD